MRSLRLERVYKQAMSSHRALLQAATEAEALADQALAEDLWQLTHQLGLIVQRAERNRYRSPLREAA